MAQHDIPLVVIVQLEWNSDLRCAIEHHDVPLAVITPLKLDYYLRRLGMTALCQTTFLLFKTLGLRIKECCCVATVLQRDIFIFKRRIISYIISRNFREVFSEFMN
jgi:hypothetical protein